VLPADRLLDHGACPNGRGVDTDQRFPCAPLNTEFVQYYAPPKDIDPQYKTASGGVSRYLVNGSSRADRIATDPPDPPARAVNPRKPALLDTLPPKKK
jgi:hypothetical protein